MDWYLLLLITYIAIFAVSIKKQGYNPIEPFSIYMLSFIVALLLGYVYRYEMGVELYFLTYIVMIVPVVLAYLIHVRIGRYIKRRFGQLETPHQDGIYIFLKPRLSQVTMQKYMFLYMVFYVIVSIAVLYYNTDGNAEFGRLTQYRDYLLHPRGNEAHLIGVFFVSQIYKIALAITYIMSYVAIYNGIVLGKPIFFKTGILPLIILFCIGSSISMAARQPAVEVFIFCILTYLFVLTKERYTKQIRRVIIYIIPCILISPFIFILFGILVGRQDFNVYRAFSRMAELLSGGIYALNAHIHEPARTIYWGQSSFADVYDKLINWGFLDESLRMSYHVFDKFGNTVTLYGRWYEDFGLVGVIVMTLLVMALFTYGYHRILRLKDTSIGAHILTVCFLVMLISLVWAGYDDRIRALVSVSSCIILGFIAILFKCLFRIVRIKRK